MLDYSSNNGNKIKHCSCFIVFIKRGIHRIQELEKILLSNLVLLLTLSICLKKFRSNFPLIHNNFWSLPLILAILWQWICYMHLNCEIKHCLNIVIFITSWSKVRLCLPGANTGFSSRIKIFNLSLTSQLGDSIVHKARETLERAIKLVNDTKKWGAHVVYGDTDRYVTVCSSQPSKPIGVLRRCIFLLPQQGGFVIPKRVCGPSWGCCLLSCRICKVNNTYFLGVSFRTFRKHFSKLCGTERGEKTICFQVWINTTVIYQMSIFMPFYIGKYLQYSRQCMLRKALFKSGYSSEAATRSCEDIIRLPEIHHIHVHMSLFSVDLSSQH